MRQRIILSFILIFLVLCISNFNVPIRTIGQSAENELNSNEALSQPLIDGVITEEEWGTPVLETWFNRTYPEEEHQVTVFILNDKVNLYIAIILTNDDYNTTDSYDKFEIQFDSNNNGIIDNREDLKVFQELEYQDWNYDNQSYSYTDFSQHGSGKATHSNEEIGDYNYECKFPLDSGDSNDIKVSSGDSMGIRFSFHEFQGSASSVSFGVSIGNWPLNSTNEIDLESFGTLNLIQSDKDPANSSDSDKSDDSFLPVALSPVFLSLFIISKKRTSKITN